ncbi:MAG: hypothetical protein AAGA90_00790 [Actinomycetota bacterium]
MAEPLTEEALIDELKQLRRTGILRWSSISTPALDAAVRATESESERGGMSQFAIEDLLRRSAHRLGGDAGAAAALLLGLAEGGREARPAALREICAQDAGVGLGHWRTAREPRLLRMLAQQVLVEVYEHDRRRAALALETRELTHSRLAVEWLSRFEAMYAVWTALTGLAGDLTAYRSTLLDDTRPYDEEPDAEDPDDEGYTQEIQAAGYVTFAIFHYAQMLAAKRDFETRFGGLWLLRSANEESRLAHALRRVILNSPNNERDDSYLRLLIGDATELELHSFLAKLASDQIGQAIHDDWQDWASRCSCVWDSGERVGRELFPTADTHGGIEGSCDVHRLISGGNDFCLLLDDAWDQVADWYRETPVTRTVLPTAEQIYAEHTESNGGE